MGGARWIHIGHNSREMLSDLENMLRADEPFAIGIIMVPFKAGCQQSVFKEFDYRRILFLEIGEYAPSGI